MTSYKQPVSVLVVIYTAAVAGADESPALVQSQGIEVLLLERADHPGYWQSVTGSLESDEVLSQTAAREVWEETGIAAAQHELHDSQIENRYEIYPQWRHRYAPDVTHNTEHVYTLRLAQRVPVSLSPREHLRYGWWPWREAAEKVFSPSNREAILRLVAEQCHAGGGQGSGDE